MSTKFYNFLREQIRHDKALGKIVRLPFKLIGPEAQIPILMGAFRGKKWIVGAGDHTYWVGIYERQKRIQFERFVNPGSVIYDLGAHSGYYTLLASVLTGAKGAVYSFEPVPANIVNLKRHIAINNLDNVHVVEAAVSDSSGTARFKTSYSSVAGKLAQEGDINVAVISLDDFAAQSGVLLPDLIKIDIEGAEFATLRGARNLLVKKHPVIFIDAHSSQLRDQCTRLLNEQGYGVEVIKKDLPSDFWDLLAVRT
jgi:FkbM family methyltransferase